VILEKPVLCGVVFGLGCVDVLKHSDWDEKCFAIYFESWV
jgi:hypothetical protein